MSRHMQNKEQRIASNAVLNSDFHLFELKLESDGIAGQVPFEAKCDNTFS
jgi:hypothetical protein